MKSAPAPAAVPIDSPAPAKSATGGKKVYASTKKIQTVTENLAHRIKNREWSNEERLPPQSHLAREYGVSQGAIAIAMRTLQKEGILQLIPGKGAFVPEQNAGQNTPAFPTIGIRGSYVTPFSTSLLSAHDDPRLFNSYGASVLQAIWIAAQQEECPLVLLPQTKRGRLTPQSCQAHGVQGVLFLGGESYEEAAALRLAGFPVITANPPSGPTPINYVNHDHAGCLIDALQQFIDIGHERIAVFFPPTTSPGSFEQLKPQFIETLCGAGLVYNFEKYWRLLPNFSSDEGDILNAVNEVLDLPEPPTAILCLAGMYSFVHKALQKRNLCVPRDISILCVPFSPATQPPVSGYTPDFGLMARTLLHGLYETIQNPFYSIQKLIPFHKVNDCGSVTPPPSLR